MSKLKLISAVSLVALVLLACGNLPKVNLSFEAEATTVPVNLPTAAMLSAVPPTLSPSPTPLPPEMVQRADAEEELLVNLYQRASPSVVSIQAVKTVTGLQPFPVPTGEPTPETPEQQPFRQTGEGSGFVVDDKGHIVTNNHVVANTIELRVTFFDGTSVPAIVIGTDPDTDLAVLKVDVPAQSLRPITWADSDRVRVGQRAVAIGNPFGFENTLTSGIVSGLSRSLPSQNDPATVSPRSSKLTPPFNPAIRAGRCSIPRARSSALPAPSCPISTSWASAVFWGSASPFPRTWPSEWYPRS